MEKTKLVTERSDVERRRQTSALAIRCRRKFLGFFPKGFHDEKYIAWERSYKWQAHERWNEQLNRKEFGALLRKKEFAEIAARAVKIERTGVLTVNKVSAALIYILIYQAEFSELRLLLANGGGIT